MSDRKHILILCYSDLGRDARVLRQVKALGRDHLVSTAAFAPAGIENGTFHRLGLDTTDLGLPVPVRKAVSAATRFQRSLNRLLKRHEAAYWTPARRHAARALRRLKTDLIIANDLNTLPLALRIAHGTDTKVLFDAHEYFPGQREDDPDWLAREKPALEELCRSLMPKADHCITISPLAAVAYEELTGIRPSVITNAPDFNDLQPSPMREGTIRLVYHGGASPSRRTGDLLAMMDHLGDGYELHLFLVGIGAEEYLAQLRDQAARRPNIHFHAAVTPEQLPATLNRFDVGVHNLPPINFNHDIALPNKLFDFVQARLAIVTSPARAMADLVRQHDLGVVADDHRPEAMAAAIRKLTPALVLHHKANAHTHAMALSSAANMQLLRSIVDRSLVPAHPL